MTCSDLVIQEFRSTVTWLCLGSGEVKDHARDPVGTKLLTSLWPESTEQIPVVLVAEALLSCQLFSSDLMHYVSRNLFVLFNLQFFATNLFEHSPISMSAAILIVP